MGLLSNDEINNYSLDRAQSTYPEELGVGTYNKQIQIFLILIKFHAASNAFIAINNFYCSCCYYSVPQNTSKT